MNRGKLHTDDLLTIQQTATMLDVSPRTIWRWCAAGLLPYIKLPGGRRRFRRGHVLVLLRERLDG